MSESPHSRTLPFQQAESPAKPGLLVIDDEPLLLQLLQTACEARGFRVLTGEGGRAGVELFRRHHQELAVVLLDVRMPDLDGPAVLAEIRQIDPHVPCCFMSGYLGAYTPEDLRTLGAVRLFPKPFKLLELTDELWALVEGLRRSA